MLKWRGASVYANSDNLPLDGQLKTVIRVLRANGETERIFLQVGVRFGSKGDFASQDAAEIAIQSFGFTNPILAGAGGDVIAGHGHLAAARQLVLADNRVALNAGWDV